MSFFKISLHGLMDSSADESDCAFVSHGLSMPNNGIMFLW